MNTVKKLPLAMAVVAALCPISVMAQEFTQEQIDANMPASACGRGHAKKDEGNHQRTRHLFRPVNR